jgi:hypothetical protein
VGGKLGEDGVGGKLGEYDECAISEWYESSTKRELRWFFTTIIVAVVVAVMLLS